MFAIKVANAVSAGHDAAVIFNEAAQAGPVTVAVATDIINETRTTTKIIADSRTGNAAKTVVLGAHRDSVLAGAGINDNGSGTSVLVETAIQMSEEKIRPRLMVGFAFWSDEEAGLLGSEHYVNSLSNQQFSTIYRT